MLNGKEYAVSYFLFIFYRHFPEQDSTLQRCEVTNTSSVFFRNFTSLSSLISLSLLGSGLKGFLVLCYVPLKGILYLRVQS